MNAATAATTVLVEDGEVPAEKPGLARVVSGALLKSYLEWVVDQPPPASNYNRQRNGRNDGPRPQRTRTAPPMEVLTPRLYIGNLSYDASESDVFDHLSKIAAVKNVEVVREGGGNSKGFGFAEMHTLEGAQEVAKKLHDTDFMGRLLIVNGAKSTGERFGGGGRQDRPPRDERPERGSEFDYERGPRNPSYD